MRYCVVVFLVALVVAGTSLAPAQQQKSSIDEILKYLLTSAAGDFHDHGPAGPLRFRNVRFGHTGSVGKESYKVCGEFQQTETGNRSEWIHFVTIKTSGYEQYIGGQGLSYCKNMRWDSADDLSATLQNKLAALPTGNNGK